MSSLKISFFVFGHKLSCSWKSNFLLYQSSGYFFWDLNLNFKLEVYLTHLLLATKPLNSVCVNACGQGVADEQRWKDKVNLRNLLKMPLCKLKGM